MRPTPPRLLALGDSAWTVEFGSSIDAATNARVMGLADHLSKALLSDPVMVGVTDLVPTFRSLTVHFDPWTSEATALGQRLLAMAREDRRTAVHGRRWQLPVCFDDEFAPDLARVCAHRQLSRADVIGHLLATTFRVYMLGFQPGFPYMGGLPPELLTPRLATPRQKVPAKSMAIALDMCAVYPWDSPGGWNLMGRTPVVLFDPSEARQPALLAAGDEVRWTMVDRADHDRLAADITRGLPRESFLQAYG